MGDARAPIVSSTPGEEVPAGVGAFLWSAFLFPFLWPAIYGLGGWALLGLLLNVFTPLSLPLTVWFAYAVNRAYWAKFPCQLSVAEFNRRQAKWILIGLVLNGLYLGYLLLSMGAILGALAD